METKKKRDNIPMEMFERLRRNRQGKMTADQWKTIVADPIVKFFTLMIPLAPVLFIAGGPRLLLLSARGLFFVLGVLILVFIVPMLLRGRHYARAKVHCATLYPPEITNPMGFLQFWKPTLLYTSAGVEMRFNKWLAPRIPLLPAEPYLVYYIEDPDNRVLLSIFPAEHPEADRWQPTASCVLHSPAKQDPPPDTQVSGCQKAKSLRDSSLRIRLLLILVEMRLPASMRRATLAHRIRILNTEALRYRGSQRVFLCVLFDSVALC